MAKLPPRWVWILALVPTVALAVARWPVKPGFAGDDFAQYILQARALAEGRPYGDTGFLWSRLNPLYGPRLRPPGVPIVLAAEIAAIGEHEVAIRLTMLALALAYVVVAVRYFARDDAWGAVGVLMLIGLAPGVVANSTRVMSDLPFCLAAWTAFLLTDRAAPWTWLRILGITVAGVAAMAFRAPGIVLAPAALVVGMLRWRELRWRGLVAPLLWFGLMAAAVAAVGLPRQLATRRWMALDAVTASIVKNAVTLRIGIGDAITRPFPWDLGINAYQLVALVPLAVGAVLWVRSSSRSLALVFSVLYTAAIMTLPYGEGRYLWPVFPIIAYAMWSGALAITRRFAPSLSPAWVVLPAGLLIATGSALTLSTHPFPRTFDAYPEVRALEAELVRLNAEHPMRVVFARPGQLALRTRIPAMPLFEAQPDTLVAELRRTCMTHVVVGSLGQEPGLDRAMQRSILARPEAFDEVYSNARFRVYRFTVPPRDGCPDPARART